MSAIEEIGIAVRTVAQVTGRSVVGIGHSRAGGSGVVVARGRVLTNAHNVRAETVHVTLSDGRTVIGRVAGSDVDTDVAVVSADTGDLPAVEWGDPAAVTVGSPVFALSNPAGKGLRVTFGLVSGTQRSFRGPRGRRIGASIEHTAPALPGSSGGPVVGRDGKLLAINTNRLGDGFYLAIPADGTLRAKVDALGRGEQPRRLRLGVGIAPAHVARRLRRAVGLPDVEGLLVRVVDDTGPAAAAGVREGDLIVSLAGRRVAGVDDLYDALDASTTGDVELELLRGTEETTVTVALTTG